MWLVRLTGLHEAGFSLLLSGFNIGQINPNFRISGISLFSRDSWKMLYKIRETVILDFFSRMADIPSGPGPEHRDNWSIASEISVKLKGASVISGGPSCPGLS
jgi:hypothetical protein